MPRTGKHIHKGWGKDNSRLPAQLSFHVLTVEQMSEQDLVSGENLLKDKQFSVQIYITYLNNLVNVSNMTRDEEKE